MRGSEARPDKGEATNIRVYKDTKKEFETCGNYGDTADAILRKLVKFYKKYLSKISGKK